MCYELPATSAMLSIPTGDLTHPHESSACAECIFDGLTALYVKMIASADITRKAPPGGTRSRRRYSDNNLLYIDISCEIVAARIRISYRERCVLEYRIWPFLEL
jgi:hypothetical protein